MGSVGFSVEPVWGQWESVWTVDQHGSVRVSGVNEGVS